MLVRGRPAGVVRNTGKTGADGGGGIDRRATAQEGGKRHGVRGADCAWVQYEWIAVPHSLQPRPVAGATALTAEGRRRTQVGEVGAVSEVTEAHSESEESEESDSIADGRCGIPV